MAWTSFLAGAELSDIRLDRKQAEYIEKYAVSGRALYFEGYYLPLENVKAVRIQPSEYYPNHSCGKGFPVTKVRVNYGSEKPLVLLLEKKENAEKLCSAVCSGNPDVIIEEYPEERRKHFADNVVV